MTWAQSLEQAWKQFERAFVAPLGAVALPALAGVIALLVVARLAMLLPFFPGKRVSNVQGRRWALRGGLGLVIVVPFLVTTMLARSSGALFAIWSIVLGVGALAGVVLVANGLSGALRLNVVVVSSTGQDSDPGAGHVVALLRQLGGETARGIEVPRGTDVDLLKTVGLNSAPTQGLAATIYQVATLIVPTSPWSIRAEAEGNDVMSVSVTRNGRPVDAAVIDRDALQLRLVLQQPVHADTGETSSTPQGPDLHWMAAAFVLVTLSRYYNGFEGLYGATDWRSVGLHAIATSEECLDETQKVSLLAQATEWDPDNWAAQIALRHAMWRYSTTAAELDQLASWVTEVLPMVRGKIASGRPRNTFFTRRSTHPKQTDPWRPLLLRLERILAVARINRLYVTPGQDEDPGLRGHAATATADLVKDLGLPLGDDAPRLERLLVESAEAMYLSTHARDAEFWKVCFDGLFDGRPEAAQRLVRWDLGPDALYNVACYLATKPKSENLEAVRLLSLAAKQREAAAWLDADPQLAHLRTTDVWRREFRDPPRQDVLSVEPLAAYRAVLRSAGVYDEADLLRLEVWQLQRLLSVDPLVVGNLLHVAGLAAHLRSTLPTCYVEVLAELVQRGRTSWPVEDPRQLSEDIANVLASRLKESPDATTIEAAISDERAAGPWLVEPEAALRRWWRSERSIDAVQLMLRSRRPGRQ